MISYLINFVEDEVKVECFPESFTEKFSSEKLCEGEPEKEQEDDNDNYEDEDMVEEDPEVDVLKVSIYGEMEAGSDSVKVSSAPGFRRLTPKRRTSAASRRAWSDAAVRYRSRGTIDQLFLFFFFVFLGLEVVHDQLVSI